ARSRTRVREAERARSGAPGVPQVPAARAQCRRRRQDPQPIGAPVMRRAIIAATITISGTASAGKLLVLKSDGNADAATKAKVEAEVITLARTLPGTQVEIGDVTFTDAAVAVGCSGSEA